MGKFLKVLFFFYDLKNYSDEFLSTNLKTLVFTRAAFDGKPSGTEFVHEMQLPWIHMDRF